MIYKYIVCDFMAHANLAKWCRHWSWKDMSWIKGLDHAKKRGVSILFWKNKRWLGKRLNIIGFAS